jgi:hypothetical protein
VRYFMVKFSRGKVIAFDLGEALNFTGESGPYVQYAVVRANKIVHNLEERLGVSEGGAGAVARRRASGGAGRRQRLPRGVGAGARSAARSTTSSSR